MDNQSITHTRWNCTYHIVFIPKYVSAQFLTVSVFDVIGS
mgnify:CR=1 FL=1